MIPSASVPAKPTGNTAEYRLGARAGMNTSKATSFRSSPLMRTTMMMIPTGAKKIFITHLRKQKQSNLFFFSAEKDKNWRICRNQTSFPKLNLMRFCSLQCPNRKGFLKKISPILASFCLFTSSSQLKYKLKRIDIVLGIRTQAPRMY